MTSREFQVMSLCGDNDKVQYDADDEKRIAGIAAMFTSVGILMIDALQKYAEAGKTPVDENSADIMKACRADCVLAWGALQCATSKIAGVLRIDGDEAFKRVLAVANTGEEPDVRGL